MDGEKQLKGSNKFNSGSGVEYRGEEGEDERERKQEREREREREREIDTLWRLEQRCLRAKDRRGGRE